MDSEFNVLWTDEAIRNFESIIEYLSSKWTSKEIINFKLKLNKQIEIIKINPFIFPISEYNTRLRKAVLSKQTTIFYEVAGVNIFLVYLFVNKQNINKLL